MKLKTGRPRIVGKDPGVYKSRHQKFYYAHRERINRATRKKYKERKQHRLCVRCGRKALPNRVLCKIHRNVKS